MLSSMIHITLGPLSRAMSGKVEIWENSPFSSLWHMKSISHILLFWPNYVQLTSIFLVPSNINFHGILAMVERERITPLETRKMRNMLNLLVATYMQHQNRKTATKKFFSFSFACIHVGGRGFSYPWHEISPLLQYFWGRNFHYYCFWSNCCEKEIPQNIVHEWSYIFAFAAFNSFATHSSWSCRRNWYIDSWSKCCYFLN